MKPIILGNRLSELPRVNAVYSLSQHPYIFLTTVLSGCNAKQKFGKRQHRRSIQNGGRKSPNLMIRSDQPKILVSSMECVPNECTKHISSAYRIIFCVGRVCGGIARTVGITFSTMGTGNQNIGRRAQS